MSKTLPILLATSLLALTSLPAGADPGDDGYQRVIGTAGVDVKDGFGFGIALCTVNQGLPTDCDQPLGQIGQAYFDISSLDPSTSQSITIWAEQVFGAGTGFAISPCSDLNDDFVCEGAENFEAAYSFTVDADGDGCEKDEKDCGDPYRVGTTVCVPVDDDGAFDELAVFIMDYVDAEGELNDDVGAGVSHGLYDVYIDYGGTC